jgi:hypothetical protein
VKPQELGMVANDAVQRVLVAPRYTGKLSLHFELICFEGGIRECAVDIKKVVTNEEVEKLHIQEKKEFS